MTRKCIIEDCDGVYHKKQMCSVHYSRWWRTGQTELTREPKIEVRCSANECNEITTSKNGLCLKHYKQRWYLNSVGRDELIERTSQGYWVNSSTGYIVIKVNGKLVYEHRHLAEKALGRPLPYGTIVHHTGRRHDNIGFCKLVICPDQEYHLLLHKRMEELGYACD